MVDFEVTESREAASYAPLAERLKSKYNIAIAASDYYAVYAKHPVAKQHITTKKETALVESKNSLLRHYLARFNRKTKRYSKAKDMIECSILLLWNKHMLPSIIG